MKLDFVGYKLDSWKWAKLGNVWTVTLTVAHVYFPEYVQFSETLVSVSPSVCAVISICCVDHVIDP